MVCILALLGKNSETLISSSLAFNKIGGKEESELMIRCTYSLVSVDGVVGRVSVSSADLVPVIVICQMAEPSGRIEFVNFGLRCVNGKT